MSVDQKILDEIVQRVLTVVSPDKIILYGSAATGTMTRDSDIDLLIVGPPNRHNTIVDIGRAVGNVSFGVDVKLIASKSFEETKNVIGGIAYPAHKYGRVLYATA